MWFGLAGAAYGADARLTWSPVTGATGYRLYVRQAGLSFTTGTNVGSPAPGGDGLLRYVTQGLPAGATSYFVMTSYDSSGRESAFSNELALQVAAPPTATNTPTRPPTSTPTQPLPTSTPTRPAATNTPLLNATRMASPTATPTGSTGRHHVSGRIRYFSDSAAVPAATVTLIGSMGTASAATDTTGAFQFDAVADGAWELQPEKLGGAQRGITALDAARVLQAVSGSRVLSPIQTVACDVTANGTLTALDAVRILQLTVGLIDHLPVTDACASDFVFMPEPNDASDMHPPLFADSICQPGAITLDVLSADAVEQNFAAAVFGDCTGNWSSAPPVAPAAALGRELTRVRAGLGEPRQVGDGTWSVPLYVTSRSRVEAIEAHLDSDPTLVAFDSLRLVGGARRAVSRQHADASGLITIAIASAHPMPLRWRPAAFLMLRSAAAPHVELLGVTVNDAEAELAPVP